MPWIHHPSTGSRPTGPARPPPRRAGFDHSRPLSSRSQETGAAALPFPRAGAPLAPAGAQAVPGLEPSSAPRGGERRRGRPARDRPLPPRRAAPPDLADESGRRGAAGVGAVALGVRGDRELKAAIHLLYVYIYMHLAFDEVSSFLFFL